MPGVRGLALPVFLCLLLASSAFAQPECPLPAYVKPLPPSKNIFSDQQEADLGDIMAESLARHISIIEDDPLNAHLRQVGNQLIGYLPPNQFRFRFFLMEFPEANAFSFAGGRVYVSRKLVAFARSDDELAGVLAHELGHIVTHQSGIEMTLRLRQVLGVTQVGDHADIADKFHRMLETWRLKPPKIPDKEEEEQYVADQVALYAMARAGFSPQAYVDALDRIQQTKGKTGSWLSDFFGATKPEQRRLRETLKSMAVMPAGCAEIAPAKRPADFQKWQSDVIAYHATSRDASLPGLVFKQALALPLRPDITNLRFSPDGKLLLAQDEGGIHVLSRDPLAFLFFIDAPEANDAHFSPDSRSIIFYTPSLRVETWDIPSHKRTSVHEIVMREICAQDALSPDGSVLACLNGEFTLSLLDVATGVVIAAKKSFYEPSFSDVLRLYFSSLSDLPFYPINMGFSPDGHYFLAGSHTASFAFDLPQRQEASFPGSIKNATHASFAFLGADRIVAVNRDSPTKSPILRFPTGERLADVPLSGQTHLEPVGHGDYVLVWPVKDHPLGLVDLNKREIIISFRHAAGDIYDGILLAENLAGEVTLTDISKEKLVGAIKLTQSRLGALRASAVSSDLGWLAVSTRTRGAIWDLAHNIRTAQVREFQGAWFADDHSLYADFPKFAETERSIARLDQLGGASQIYQVGKTIANQAGPYLVVSTPANEKSFERKNWTLEVRDFLTKSSVWSRRFPKESPVFGVNPGDHTILLVWSLWQGAARDELMHYPHLKPKADKDDYLLELIDFRRGTTLGALVVDTNKGSFLVRDYRADGDWVTIGVSGDRVLVYSLASAEQKGHVFGVRPALSAASGQFAVSTASGEVNVYDLATSQLYRQFKFPTSIALKQFSPDGKRLFVLTRDQTAYVLDLTAQ